MGQKQEDEVDGELREVGESHKYIILTPERIVQALCHVSPNPHSRKLALPALAQPPACGYHLTEFFQALGPQFLKQSCTEHHGEAGDQRDC